jgi:hypothetical protein
MVVVIALALADVFGERPTVSSGESDAARLEVSAPDAIRGGLFFQARFDIAARRPLRHATLLLDRGWYEQLSINTISPAPAAESSNASRLALDFGPVAAGEDRVVYLQFQANPAQFFSRRPQGVSLADGDEELVRIDRSLAFYP